MDCGTYPDNKERLIISSKWVPIKGTTSLSSLVGMGSNRQVDVFDEEIIEVNWWRLTAEKHSKYTSEVAPVKVSDVGEPAISYWGHLVTHFLSNSNNFIIKEVNEVIAT